MQANGKMASFAETAHLLRIRFRILEIGKTANETDAARFLWANLATMVFLKTTD